MYFRTRGAFRRVKLNFLVYLEVRCLPRASRTCFHSVTTSTTLRRRKKNVSSLLAHWHKNERSFPIERAFWNSWVFTTSLFYYLSFFSALLAAHHNQLYDEVAYHVLFVHRKTKLMFFQSFEKIFFRQISEFSPISKFDKIDKSNFYVCLFDKLYLLKFLL